MTIDEIIKDLQKLRDERLKVYEEMQKPTTDSLIVLAQLDGMTIAIGRLVELADKETQEQKQ